MSPLGHSCWLGNSNKKLRYSWAVELDTGSTGEARGAANGERLEPLRPIQTTDGRSRRSLNLPWWAEER